MISILEKSSAGVRGEMQKKNCCAYAVLGDMLDCVVCSHFGRNEDYTEDSKRSLDNNSLRHLLASRFQ